MPPRIGNRGARYVATIAVLLLTACGTPRMDNAPAQSIDLSGRWVLDRPASDDVRARLQPLIEKAENKWRKIERRLDDRPLREREVVFAEPSSADSGSDRSEAGGAVDNSTLHWVREQRQREAQALVAFLSPATQLDIRQSAHEIRFSSDKGEGSRTLAPGEQSGLFLAVGGFAVNSGWHAGSFIVDSRGTGDNAMRVVEYYTLLAQGEQLEERVEVRLPNLGKQVFRFVYLRARQ